MSATDKKDTVILVTSDEENFTVERKVAERSVLIKSMLEGESGRRFQNMSEGDCVGSTCAKRRQS